MSSAAEVIEIAKAEAGYLEKATNEQLSDKTANAGSGNYTKYAHDLDNIPGFYNGRKNGYPWCDVFVDWCFYKAFGVDEAKRLLCHGTSGAGCTYSAGYFAAAGQFYSSPKPGDQIFFGTGLSYCYHCALVYDVDDTYVYTIEGNTSSAAGVVPNGGGVYMKSYRLTHSSIVGYGRPLYNESEDVMTGKEIYEALMEYTATLQLPDDLKEEYSEAVSLGITDGERPMQPALRAQAAIMVKRALENKEN